MNLRPPRSRAVLGMAALACVAVAGFPGLSARGGTHPRLEVPAITASVATTPATTSPIKHVVVIFQENVSFDHYFGTYPKAANASGEPFYAAPGTPTVNGLTPALLTKNPNGVNPARLDPSEAGDLLTCDEDPGYTAEQTAFDGGRMDKFVSAAGDGSGSNALGQPCQASQVMDYYDGNTATALWNYAQHYAMSDDYFGTTFGPSASGAINLVSGSTGGVDTAHSVRGAIGLPPAGDTVPDGTGGQTLIGEAQPYWDDCSSRDAVAMTGTNIGNLLNDAGLSWGWFQGGFTASTAYTGKPDTASTYNQLDEPGRATCTTAHDVGAAFGGTGSTGAKPWGVVADYVADHDPFQYYASTANPHHLAPASLAAVGTDTATPGEFDTANHQYDVSWFNALVAAIKAKKLPPSQLPAVSFLKAPAYEDGHAYYSDALDEQQFVVDEVNAIEALPSWPSTVIFITYDDSDGWYDHAYSGVHNTSATSADDLTASGSCGPSGSAPLFNEQGRCGYGPRLPLIVISPYAKPNYVSHVLTDQSSILAFICANFSLGQIPGSAANVAGSLDDLFDFATAHPDPRLVLSPRTGEPGYPVVGAIAPASGPVTGGTVVTVHGLNFSTVAGGTIIHFGSRGSPKVTCISTFTCLATTPKASTTGAVQVTAYVDKTVSVDDANSFTYTP